ncbi:hypothetical protein LTR66_004892 [Elasticomyces elasticus]|nr:hypothetical protein LTR66_004892 [Elasticomyces elasticus]
MSALTRLYTEAKRSCNAVIGLNTAVEDDNNAPGALQRKLRIQKNRFVAWGLEWSDEDAQGNIDRTVSQAGLTEIVESVLGNIQDVFLEAERIGRVSATTSPRSDEKALLSRSRELDASRYDDLLKDLTASIDTLYDLTRSRRGSSRTAADEDSPSTKGFASQRYSRNPPYIKKAAAPPSIFGSKSFADSELTLVNPPTFSRPTLSPYVGLPPRIDLSALRLPEEGPPPYETPGTPVIARTIAHIDRTRAPETVRASLSATSVPIPMLIPVLIEYAVFDATYQHTGVPPPLRRLEALFAFLQRPGSVAADSLKLLGYFEDPHQARIGLVYDFINAVQSNVIHSNFQPNVLGAAPISLLRLLQIAAKTQTTADRNLTLPLEQRFRLARKLVNSLRELHCHGFTHGNITSGSIVFCSPGVKNLRGHEYDFPSLCAFDIFSDTTITGGVRGKPSVSALNIYRHPRCHEAAAGDAGTLRRVSDLYGLGLVLLEIGLWTPLGDLYKPKYSLADFRKRLDGRWVKYLAAKCCSAYMYAVQTCLRLSDSNDPVTESAVERTYNRALLRLDRCCSLDVEDDLSADEQRSVGVKATKTCDQPPIQQEMHPITHVVSAPAEDTNRRLSIESKRSIASAEKPYRLSSLPNISAVVPLAVAGLSAATSPPTRTRSRSRGSSFVEMGSEGLHALTVEAASTIQRAWRCRKESTPFKDYRRKVTVIQTRWRERMTRQSGPSAGELTRSIDNNIEPARQLLEEDVVGPLDQRSASFEQQFLRQRRKLRMRPIRLSPNLRHDWQSHIAPALVPLMERILKDSPESSSIGIVGIGDNPEMLQPTILITCTSTARVRAILKRKFSYDKNTWDLVVMKSKITRSRRSRRSARRSAAGEPDDNEPPVLNPYHQPRPVCGASIGAFRGEHLPAVSYGGVVLVDGEPFGMSVHHMLDPESEDDTDGDDAKIGSPMRSMFAPSRPTPNTGYDVEHTSVADQPEQPYDASRPRYVPRDYHSDAYTAMASERQPPQTVLPFEISDNDDDEGIDISDTDSIASYASSEFLYDIAELEEGETGPMSSFSEAGDIPGIAVGAGRDITITQPALDDVYEYSPNFFPDKDTRDDDHLSSHTLGWVHASSGIRRSEHGDVKHEVDWALLKLHPARLQPHNLIQGGKRHCHTAAPHQQLCSNLLSPIVRHGKFKADEDLYPIDITREHDLGNKEVHCFGRTSGLRAGLVGDQMELVKIYPRETYSSSWLVWGGFGVAGDSGAWIVDNADGRVVGHVLAWDHMRRCAYMCPMEVLLLDMKATLGASRVTLPGAEWGLGIVSAGLDAESLPRVAEASVEQTRSDEDLVNVVGILGLDGPARAAAGTVQVEGRLRRLPPPPIEWRSHFRSAAVGQRVNL